MANRRTGTAARSGGRVQTTQTRSYRSAQTARSARGGVQMTRTYIDGNTVRKVSYAEPVRRQPEADPRKESRARAKRNRENAKRMTPGFVVFLAAASVAFLLICTQYLQAQALVTANQTTIEALEDQLREIRTENDYHANAIEAMTDINHIYEVATQELGMVYPEQGQVITYDSSTSEYVRQSETLGR